MDATNEVLASMDWMIDDLNFRRQQTGLDSDPLSPEIQKAMAVRDELRAGRIECRRLPVLRNTGETVREALDQKRVERKPDCTGLVLCKYELFYLPDIGNRIDDTVYPVALETARKEAEWFGVPLMEQ